MMDGLKQGKEISLLKTKTFTNCKGTLRDQFILQEDGYGVIVGRITDMIIRGGENIYPKEIEDYLNTHQEILEAHVIGVPDERLGEEVCVFLRIQEGSILTPEDVINYCKGHISYHKIPKYINIVEELPKTPVGKVQKFKLREMFFKLCMQ